MEYRRRRAEVDTLEFEEMMEARTRTVSCWMEMPLGMLAPTRLNSVLSRRDMCVHIVSFRAEFLQTCRQ